MVDELTELFELHDGAEMRLARARNDEPLACALVMAALCWDRVDPRGWRAPGVLCAQARRLMAVWGACAEAVDDADRVSAALEWATRDPALLERDGQGSYRSVYGVAFPVGLRFWRECHRAAVLSGVLTPLERVIKGDDDRDGSPADLDAAEVSYQLAVDGDDPDATALASLRLAELAEWRDQPAQAARRYTDVAALRHPVASPPAVLWLARHAAQNGDVPTARELAHEVIRSGDGSLRAQAWGLLGSLAWQDKDTDAAVAALRQAVEAAGRWHGSYSRSLAEMLAARGELAGAADVYRTLLDHPLLHGPDTGRYVQLMIAAGRGDEAVAVLEQYTADDGPFAGDLLLALASAHAARDDLDATRQVLARVRAHWSAVLPQISVRTEVMEASVAAAAGDDERAARLFRSLTDTDDTERRDLARPLLIAAGEQFAMQGKLCLIPGVRPLLEYLSEAAPPDTAAWAATSLAHLATMQGRPDDAEAAVRLAARHRSPEEVTVLRTLLLDRPGRSRDALAYLIDAAVAATLPALGALLPIIAVFGIRGFWPDEAQRLRLRTAVDHALSADQSEGIRDRIAMAMAQVELYSCFNRDRAIELWHLAAESDDPSVAASAWLNLGLTQQHSAPITAAHAFEQAMLLEDTPIAGRAAIELARLAERLGDNPVLARACTRTLELTSGDDRAQAALRLGRIKAYNHPDEAEEAYNTAIAEPGAHPTTIGSALARLGALYALHGNRRLAERIWRRGRRHRDPHVAEAFAAERAAIGRVRRITK
jgi:tetratricopeptide (TPR) repeat protein